MFRHYLNFLDLPLIGKIEISEPFLFDGQTHKIMQDEGRYGRDNVKANEKIKLKFFKDNFEFIEKPQISIDGVLFNHASHGFDYLVNLFESKGWESEVEYIIEKDGSSFTTGIIDFFTIDIKEDEIEFNIIQNTNREVIKRREDVYINAFSDKDLDGNTITPCSTSNILLKSKSIISQSKWKTPNTLNFAVVADNFHYFNPSQQVEKYEINNTLSWLNPLTANPFNGNNDVDANNYGILYALNDTSDITVNITNLDYRFSFPSGANQRRVTQEFVLSWGYQAQTPLGKHSFFGVSYDEFTPPTDYIDTNNYSYTIPFVPAGAKVFLYFVIGVDVAFSDQDVSIASMDVDVTATETGIDSVIKGVRLIDLLKHNVKSISGMPLQSEIYDIGGGHYDNFAFNGYLISQFLDKPFNNRFKDLMNIPKELNADYQISTNKVEILPYECFYKNIEIGTLIELTDQSNNTDFNKRYFLKTIEYGYKKSSFENANNEIGTLDDVHTESQYLYPSTKTDGIFKIDIQHVRSAFLIEKQRKRFIFEKKTSENDDTLFLLDVIPSTDIISKVLNRILKYFQGKIYSDGTFNWLLLGISLGDTIIVNGVGVTVLLLEELIITTSGSFSVGIGLINIEYELTDVDFVSRSTEGFSVINGVLNPNNYSNLRYHIKRNLLTYEGYLATAGKYLPNKSISNTLFRVNDKLETQLDSEAFLVKDKGDIVINDIARKKILNPLIHNITVFCDFDKATELFKKIETDKGFLRIQTIKNKIVKGYPIDAEYEWATNKLTLKLEEKFESDFMTIDRLDNVIFINEVGYQIKLGLNRYEINNNFVSLYDSKNIMLSNPISFENIKINGINYNNVIDFTDAIYNILV
jgi:hypothetical protein